MAKRMNREDAQEAIYGYKLDDIVDILKKQKGWTNREADLAEKWYRNFLWLSYVHIEHPVQAIVRYSDDLWHAHMLYTRRYREFVVPVFGRFLDHTPISGPVKRSYVQEFERAMNWYDAEFGHSTLGINLNLFIGQCY
jgi:hypothetical protein